LISFIRNGEICYEMKKFDLNIEEVLEDWEVYHALREIISNALDEQILSKTKDMEITKDGDRIKIRDFGRGLKYEHLTQKENQEKLNNPELVIGKFGVGLKDGLATLNRHKRDVKIKTKHGDITLEKTEKHGFDDIVTLHAIISDKASEPDFVGTEFSINPCSLEELSKAKSLFLIFSGEKTLDKTKFGEILQKKSEISNIYISGVKVAEEENFLFSYNITSMTSAMRKSLNRERTNVGRTAYTDRIKSILLASKDPVVAKHLVGDLEKFEQGTQHDELNWDAISVHACKILNSENVVFVTPSTLHQQNDLIDQAKRDGYELVVIPETINEKIQSITDFQGNSIRDLSQYRDEFNESFEFDFVSIKELTDSEREVFSHKNEILKLIGGKPKQVNEIKISETMRLDSSGFNAVGLWQPAENRIIIKRSQLSNLNLFAGTLLHETAHATSGASDVSREFELELTRFLGKTATKSGGLERS